MHYYIHIPFCRQKCPYCKFALTPIFDTLKKRRYIEYVKKEIREYFIKKVVSREGKDNYTIYFGGGTPSVLSIAEVSELLQCFPFYQKSEIEISFECNPEDITSEYTLGLVLLGVNRLSVGVQSLNDVTLQAIHRSNRESIFHALESIKCVISNIPGIAVNVDFILGLPHTQPGETLKNIQEIHEAFPYITHTSVYMLEDELYPNDWKQYSLSDEQIQRDFLEIMEYFESIGWYHYELSNFAKPGYECIHNMTYWNHSEYRGFGLSASSLIKSPGQGGTSEGQGGFCFIRQSNASSFTGYYLGKKDEEVLSESDIEVEKMMFGLRTSGLKVPLTREEDLSSPHDKGGLRGVGMVVNQGGLLSDEKIQPLIAKNLLEIREGKILPTKTGIFLLDYIMGELL